MMKPAQLETEPPKDFYLLDESGFANPQDENRPTRLCICFSDVHFTDGTVGNQSADAVVWQRVFENIADLCVDYQAEELTLVLVGDVADMIRTAQWSQHGVYPWQRSHPKFKPILRSIMQEIIHRHAQPASTGNEPGFFYLLQQLPKRLQTYKFNGNTSRVKHIRTLVLLGNHDKEIFADEETLKMFYEQCLGQKMDNHSTNRLSDDYRRWIGKMYFDDENKYLADAERTSVPWLPFYWGDPGFRLFVTHGQWRDQDNSRRITGAGPENSWQVSDGWQLKRWQNIKFAPFTEACFGDTVAAGVLSGFIYRCKLRLADMSANASKEQARIARLLRVLDELDLYRPTLQAVRRIMQETRQLSRSNHELASIRNIIEEELLSSLRAWLSWDFTLASASPLIALILRIAKPVLVVLKMLGMHIELGSLYSLLLLINWLQQWKRDGDELSFDKMRSFPGFLEDYRRYGFRIHGEGHTHVPLQEEMYFKEPEHAVAHGNYTYINFGTWRDQLLPKKDSGYRRRGMGRALVILDAAGGGAGQPRHFSYWIQDLLTWGDKADQLD